MKELQADNERATMNRTEGRRREKAGITTSRDAVSECKLIECVVVNAGGFDPPNRNFIIMCTSFCSPKLH